MRASIIPLVVRADRPGSAGCTVVKVGGGLLTHDGCFSLVCAALASAHRAGTPLVVVGGGGPFADAVRTADAAYGIGDDAAHWMAIAAMDQFAYWLAASLPQSVVVVSPYQVGAALDSGRLPVFAPGAWLRDTDTLPHSWDVTSDALSAYLAGAIDAARLVLLKPTDGELAALTDKAFARTVPRGLRVDALDARCADLADQLR